MTKNQEEIVKLAKKKGDDADLFLLQKMQELEKLIPDLNKVLDSVRGKDGKDSIVAGPKGEKGDRGLKGDKGDTGLQGIKGLKGDKGEQGLRGLTGDRGLTGLKGERGRDGKDGKDGVSGAPVSVFGYSKQRVWKIDLSDQLNGVLKTFTLGTHFGILAVDSSSSPYGAFREGVDYNEVGRTIEFTASVDAEVSLATGQSLIVKVLK